MTLQAGSHLGPYEVLAPLGAGGMGEVYRARDTRLGRDVAIKVLPEAFASDLERLKRFEREARSASALNHPNIVTIYDIGSSDSISYIAMELVDGESLRALLLKGALRLRRLFQIGVQMADGLARAHASGIVHRDLKPENVMVTEEGLVKILDFGLAKLTQPEGVGAAAAQAPTVSGETAPGFVMGTAGYMSPEQALGQSVDFRSDQFAFGSILYEMATGRRAFHRASAPETLTAVIREEPEPIAALNPTIPAPVRWIVERCLAKEPRQRYASTDDLARDLATVRDHISEISSGAPLARSPRATARVRVTLALGGVFTLLLVAVVLSRFAKHQPLLPPQPKLRQLTSNSAENPVRGGAISPDGKYLAYTDGKGMHVKLIDSGETQTVPEPEALKGRGVFWEIGPWFPDSTRFLANAHPPGLEWSSESPPSPGTSIWAASVLGGPLRKLRDEAVACSVSPDGSLIAFGTHNGKFGDREIWLMGPGGEGARKLYETDENSRIFLLNWFRDGQRVAYLREDESGTRLVTRGLKGGPITTIFPSTAVPASVMEKIGNYAWSPDGRLIYSLPEPEPSGKSSNFWETKLDPRTGAPVTKPRRLTSWGGFFIGDSSVTADGKRLAFVELAFHSAVDVAALEANGMRIATPRRLTLSDSQDHPMDWTTDSKAVVFTSNRSGHNGIYKQALDEDTAEPLVVGPEEVGSACLSPDGAWVLYRVFTKTEDPSAPAQIMRVPITGGPSQLIYARPLAGTHRCARRPADFCAVTEMPEDRKQFIFMALDPLKGRGPELTRIQADPNSTWGRWDLSPDGTRIAVFVRPRGPIEILSLHGQPKLEIRLKDWSNMQSLNWAADGKALLVANSVPGGAVLLHVDLQGNASVLWRQQGSIAPFGRPSPDGRYLAMQVRTTSGNIWMMEGF